VTVGETVAVPDVLLAVKLVPVQLVALVELHVRVEELPLLIAVGEAERVTVGVACAVTVTVALPLALPPAPVHVIEYVVLVVGEILTLPEVPFAVKLVPVQEVVLVDDQLSAEELPEVMEAGEAERVAVGG
jgi:hypothetical protein